VNCSDPRQPGVKAILEVMKAGGNTRANCDAGHYYLVNNYSMYWNEDGSTNQLGSDKFVLPPQTNKTIADNLTAHDVSWKYYSADRAADVKRFPADIDGVPLPFHSYCGICDPLTAYTSIMTTSEKDKLVGYGQFLDDLSADALPAVSFVRPFEALAAHPADSTTDQYEMFLADLIAKVQAQPKTWKSTAILITTDEGGGYYDSGYIQPVDFFGDGTRHPVHRRLAVREEGPRRPRLPRPRVDREVHRGELEPADAVRAQPRQPAQPGRDPGQSVRAGQHPGRR
jgi:phospholipase C